MDLWIVFRRDNQRLCCAGVDTDMLGCSKGDEAPRRVYRCAVAGGVAVGLMVKPLGVRSTARATNVWARSSPLRDREGGCWGSGEQAESPWHRRVPMLCPGHRV